MRFFILCSLFLLHSHSAFCFEWEVPWGEINFEIWRSLKRKDVRIFWWNIQYGALSKKTKNAIDRNLIDLIEDPFLRPDLLFLGEIAPYTLKEETQNLLGILYPYQKHFPYHSDSKMGIAAFSQIPWNTLRTRPLDWTPNRSSKEKEEYRKKWEKRAPEKINHFKKIFIEISFILKNQIFSVIPVHLLMPWKVIQKQEGTLETLKQINSGKEHPLFYQTQRLTSFLKKISNPLVTFGDFNFPKRLFSKTKTANLLDFLNPLSLWGNRTFPALSDPKFLKFPPLKIDHAWSSKEIEIKNGFILPLKGSDHYPIVFDLKLY
ncbi:MAG: hypothetical protein CL678_03185 [Bdellovibrionaceae bacterium]|nr:hypothetical protein [Pseudobdellovibrionaceae bacterium]|tara:strand:- start:11726 stop:12682 length:957 start_codon:yes stop_codon:yes gene_type:complete